MKQITVIVGLLLAILNVTGSTFAEQSAEPASGEAQAAELSEKVGELRRDIQTLVKDQGLTATEAQAHRLHLEIEKVCSGTEFEKTSQMRENCERSWRDFRAANRYLRKMQ